MDSAEGRRYKKTAAAAAIGTTASELVAADPALMDSLRSWVPCDAMAPVTDVYR